ncbi:hypothetical protein [uncultured Microscilla sp.]|uniref:hypothetical protein n=1 Tax=uncultured Microscilla sp. TaxID=432653 RepID=UPI002623A910|nr:hypothetical protein [uncultured Microscilla sp.]
MLMSRWKKLKVMVAIVLILLIGGIILFPFVFTFIIIGGTLRLIRNQRASNAYQSYIKSLEGKDFFCYNNREKGRRYIEHEILPTLPPQVEVLYLQGRRIDSQQPYNGQHLLKTFHNFDHFTQFPHLLKIRNGQAISCSLFHELFECLDKEGNKDTMLDKIQHFFAQEA